MRMARGTACAAACLLLAGCNLQRKPGAVPGRLEQWYVTSSGLEFGACSDEPSFRSQISHSIADVGSVFSYRVSADGATARLLTCTSWDPATCVDAQPVFDFTVSGTELIHAEDKKQAVGKEGCNLVVSQDWTASDEGQHMTLSVSNALSLVDAPAACEQVDKAYVQHSPNGLGIQGCVFIWRIQLSQDPPAQ